MGLGIPWGQNEPRNLSKHDSELGSARAHALFDRIKPAKKVDVPRSFGDYDVTVDDANMPPGVQLLRLVG